MKDDLKLYAELKRKMKEIQAQIDELNPKILAHMGDNEEIETPYGMFIQAKRRSWKYPAHIEELDKRLKEDKKNAERTGDASYEEKPYLLFKGK